MALADEAPPAYAAQLAEDAAANAKAAVSMQAEDALRQHAGTPQYVLNQLIKQGIDAVPHPRLQLAMVQALIGQMLYFDPVVYDWEHIQVPTLAFGGADDMLLGTAAAFQERMAYIAKTVPNGNGKLLLLPGLGHVPHLEAPEKVLPPLVEFLKAGLSAVK